VLLPLHLPPAKESARAFGLGNKDLLAQRWHDACDEYRDDISGAGRGQPPGLGEFKSWWAQSPKHNRLGRLVFLGTPFFYKRFWPRLRWQTIAIEAPCWFVVLAVVTYFSRRIDPIGRSAKPFCQGDAAAIGLSRMPMARNRRVTTAP